MKNKKGQTWSIIGKVLLALITLLIVFFVISKIGGKSFDLVDKIKSLLGA